MIWLTWRQFRTQALVVFSAVAALAVVLMVTGLRLLDSYHADKLRFISDLQFNKFDGVLYKVSVIVLYVAPPVIGAFWGAPLVARELEAGTHRVVWNQSITRNRWLATKLVVTGLAAAAAVGALSLAITWWSSPIDREIGNGHGNGLFNLPWISPTVFGARGIVPIGYTVFAFALGVTVGLILRRSVFAIAVTLVAVVVLQVAMPAAIRVHLVTPVQSAFKITPEKIDGIHGHPSGDNGIVIEGFTLRAGNPGDWMIANHTVNSAGKVVDQLPSWVRDCVPRPPGIKENPVGGPSDAKACFTRLADAGYRQQVTYQPASRFWTLQIRETGILVALALLLSGFCFWRIRRDLT